MHKIIENTDTIIRKIRDKIYEETKNMTVDEELKYYRNGAIEFQRRAKTVNKSDFNFDELKNKVKITQNDKKGES